MKGSCHKCILFYRGLSTEEFSTMSEFQRWQLSAKCIANPKMCVQCVSTHRLLRSITTQNRIMCSLFGVFLGEPFHFQKHYHQGVVF